MTPEETENVARSVVFDHLDDGVEFLDISENDDVPDDVSDEELEEIIKQIRQRFTDREPPGRRRVDRGHRHPLARRHGFSREPRVVSQRHCDVGHRHLPWPNHLVAVGEPADGAVADGDQEALRGDGRVTQHVVCQRAQIDRRQIKRWSRPRHPRDIARHPRRLGWRSTG